MKLEAVWFKNGKEVYKVDPVLNIVCFEEMDDVLSIEINDGHSWHSCESKNIDADDFVIRTKAKSGGTKK